MADKPINRATTEMIQAIKEGTIVAGKAKWSSRTYLTSDNDLDDITEDGLYYWGSSTPTNAPCTYGIMFAFHGNSEQYKQLVYRQGSATAATPSVYTAYQIYFRSQSSGNGNFMDWVTIPVSNGTYSDMTVGTANKIGSLTEDDVVNTSGTQTISGKKTFTATTTMKGAIFYVATSDGKLYGRYGATSTGYAYIDFCYGGTSSWSSYTSNIYESASGTLSINGHKFTRSGNATFPNGLEFGGNIAIGVSNNVAAATYTGDIAIGGNAEATAINSISIGWNAINSGAYAIAIGSVTSNSGKHAIVIGYQASSTYQYSVTLGGTAKAGAAQAVALGYGAYATGNNSVALGYNSTASGLGSLRLGSAGSITGQYSVGIGYGVSSSTAKHIQIGSSSYITSITAATSISTTSDERDKTDIEEFDDEKSLEFITSLKTVTYVRNPREAYEYIKEEVDNSEDDIIEESIEEEIDEETAALYAKSEEYREKYGMGLYDKEAHTAGTKKGSRRRAGLLAQDVQEQMKTVYGDNELASLVNDTLYDKVTAGEEIPEGVESKLSVAYSDFIPFLISAIKAQQKQIDELKAKIEALESDIS